jgi:hypothetical protein
MCLNRKSHRTDILADRFIVDEPKLLIGSNYYRKTFKYRIQNYNYTGYSKIIKYSDNVLNTWIIK